MRAFEEPKLGRRWLGDAVPQSSLFPQSWFGAESEWLDIKAGKYHHRQHIDALELRAQVDYLEYLARIPASHDSHALSVCDNSAATHVLNGGRAKVWRLRQLCRKRYSLERVTGVKLHASLCGTSAQPLDRLSRTLRARGPVVEAAKRQRHESGATPLAAPCTIEKRVC